MLTMKCFCGYLYDLTPIPDEGYNIIADRDLENYIKAEVTRDRLMKISQELEVWNDLINADKIVCDLVSSLYECPNCGKLIWNRADGTYSYFEPYNKEQDTSDEKIDVLVEYNEIPIASAGAPIPIVLADEHTTVLEYYMQDWLNIDGEDIDQIAIVSFRNCLMFKSGPPNDEAISGHPLYEKGLRPYTFYIIENSSTIKTYEKRNRVHPYHNKSLFEDYVHYIFVFHDSIFECIAKEINCKVVQGKLFEHIDTMKETLG